MRSLFLGIFFAVRQRFAIFAPRLVVYTYAIPLVELFSSSNPQRKKIQLAILTAGIQYLALHKDISPFCGIDFNDLPIEELREALQVVIDELDQR